MSAVQQKLRDLGLAPDAIQTVTVDLQAEFDYTNGRRTLRGYVARNAIEVRLDTVDRVGEVLDAAVGAGATSVGDVRFDLKNRDEVEREALRQASADARARAEAIAAGAGRTLDQVIRLEEQRMTMPPPRPVMRMRAEALEAAPPTPVLAGEIEVRAMVTLTATLK
jgi:uncharacterized protein YggE